MAPAKRMKDEEAPGSESDDQDFEEYLEVHPKVLYGCVMGFSALCFVFAVWLLLFPHGGDKVLSMIAGCCLVICGLFLCFNVDIVVSYMRMRHEMAVFEANNEEFEEHIQEEEAVVAKLRKSKDALGRINQEFGGDVKRASQESEKLKAVTRTSLGNSCRAICKLYTDKDRDRLIDKGEEMDQTLELLASIFGGFVPDWPEREAQLRAGLLKHPKYKDAGGVKQNVFSDAMQCTIELEINQIKPRVVQIMDAIP